VSELKLSKQKQTAIQDNKKDKLVDYFTKRVKYYFFEVFKLYDYELSIGPQTKIDVRASAYWHEIEVGAQMANICYSVEWLKDNPSKKEIDIVAFHECAEVLLSELQGLVNANHIKKGDLAAAVHRVVRRLENVVFEKFKDVDDNKHRKNGK